MKKFFVGLLSIFLLVGASILSACGSEKPVLTLSQQSVEIELYSGDVDGGYETVTAEVSNASDTSISVSANGYENIVKLSTEPTTSGKTLITITGLKEGYAEVVVRTNQGNAYKTITVDVYSEVTSMTQKTEEVTKKKNFAIRGMTNTLIENNLIEFQPSQNSRRTITWTFENDTQEMAGASIDGNLLTITNEYLQDSIILKATTENGISTLITLPVVSQIESDVSFEWSYSENSEFQEIDSNQSYTIVPNVPTDDFYEGFISVNYAGELDITPVVTTKAGVETTDVTVVRYAQYNDRPLFKVYANKDKVNINGDYIIYFEIGYTNYDYSINSLATCPINISLREKVNGIAISTGNAGNIEGSEQTIYTDYAGTSEKGKEFNVSITPTTVIGATNRYSISVHRESAGEAIAEGCPVEIWYRDTLNGNIWTQIPLVEDPTSGDYVTTENNLPNVNKIYIKASSTLKVQSYSGISLTFTSEDNNEVSTSFNVKLVRSVSIDDFVFEDADFRVDSSVQTGVTIRKTFTLKGQTSVEGLYIINNSQHVDISAPQKVSNDEDSVTFDIVLTLKNTSYGVTSLDSYQIAHENGLISDKFNIDIFLPLKNVGVLEDTKNVSNSVTDRDYSNIIYSTTGEVLYGNASNSVSRLMLKNGSTTPVIYSYNSVGSQNAVAKLSVSYYDYSQSGLELQEYKNLINSPAGVAEIINKSRENVEQISGVANFSNNNSNIITKSVGFTYAVLSFTGKGVDNVDDNGNVTLIRIILIESYVGPDGLNITPNANKQVSLYANDTVATRDQDETTKRITINFSNSQVTYYDMSNFEFVSLRSDSNGNPVMGEQTISGNSITWENGRYSITNISRTSNSLSFDVVALTTMSDHAFYDDLLVHYILKNEAGKVVTDIYTPISITIKNAQRIESVIWENSDDDGIYFEVGTKDPYYMLLQTSPTNAKNNNMAYIVTDENGGYTTDFVSVSSNYSANTLAVNLPSMINEGMIGYIYVLPEDAIYNNAIKYYYLDNDKEKSSSISVTALGTIKDVSTQQTWYEYLVEEGYFKSITSADSEKNISFADVLLKIKVTVADGRSFEHAYRIYDASGFVGMKSDLYYTVMNSIDLTGASLGNENYRMAFSGGLQGYSSDVTVKLNGYNFTDLLAQGATIRNITFSGNVTNNAGFVVGNNEGTISNVTVDVDDIYSSTLTITNGNVPNVGGIAGINNSLIENSRVLGLTIDVPYNDTFVGGIAGQNAGIIRGAVVEFYKLANRNSTTEDDKYIANTFTGYTVGGLVGKILNGSTIERSYVYDYNISSDSGSVLIGYASSAQTGNFAGAVDDTTPDVTKIDYSFSVLNEGNPYFGYVNENEKVKITNSYIGYYAMNAYTTLYLPDDVMINDNYVEEGETGFLSYVNNGKAHLKDLYQDEKVSDVSGYSIQTTDTTFTNGYYKAIGVSGNQGILFNYKLKDNPNDLTTSEQNDINELNTISLAELVGQDNISRNIIISSSSSSILKIVGSDIVVNRTGDVILTLSSKQDVSINKEIYVKVIYAMSDIVVSWTDVSGYTNVVENDSLSYLQKTKTRDYIVNFEKTSVILGNTAQRFDLVENDNINMTITLSGNTESNQTLISYQKISNEVFKFTANDTSVETKVNLSAVVFENQTVGDDDSESEKIFKSEEYQNAINKTFARNFNIIPVDGVITFEISGNNLPITPSTNGTVRVQIETTDKDDYIIPQVRYNDEELSILRQDSLYSYLLPRDEGTANYILDARVSLVSNPLNPENGVYTFIYDVNFAVNNSYKNRISDDFVFNVSFISKSGNDSRDGATNGSFDLTITKQNFTNVDVSNIRITNSYYSKEGNEYVTVHETGSKTGVLAPGNSSILQINVNPSFAYYDYMDISYSGATVSNAVNIELVKPYNGRTDRFARATDSNVQTVGSALRFTPTADEKESGVIYFKLWINSTVNSDSTIKFTIRFNESEGNEITFVNYYLSISYLKEPIITVDGKDTAYLAKGSSAEVEITVLADQTVESPIVVGDDVRGINISSLSEGVIDEIKGTKTYTATLSASVLAGVAESANDTFYVQATVNRDLNGIVESKVTTATVVLVDFKVDTNNVEIANSDDNHIDVWLGVPKTFDVNYNLIPEEYNYDASDEESSNVVSELMAARNSFATKLYYPANEQDAKNSNYLINYVYDENTKEPVAQTLVDRLYYVINGNELVHVNDASVVENSPIEFIQSGDDVVVVGKTMGATVELVLKTYISAGGLTSEYRTHFTVTVEAYSDPDLPLTISNASQFKNLNPANYDEISQNDYILTNDIVLENFTPFDSSMIRSLDGNGYTIFIKSFNVEPESNTLNLALFNTVADSTVLKNVRVNLYNGGQLTIDISRYTSINIAGIAITNRGTITNSEVVAFYSEEREMGDVLMVDSCLLHNNPTGINVKYINGRNTTEEVYLTQNSKWTSNIAGFVLTNQGSITNSRVGGDSITIIDSEKLENGSPIGYTYASTLELGTFNIVGQGNMAGFVLSNAGAIASSFVKQLDMDNKSQSTDFYTSGFAGSNSSSIITSYVEGVDTPNTVAERSVYAKEGSSIKSTLGYVVGFIYTNNGNVKDSYSNILISNSTDTSRVYLASGFVYINRGVLENCYSASQITNSKFTQMNFSGVDNEGNLLAEGTYTNCYFFNKAYESFEDTNDTTTESQFGTGALMVTNPSDTSNFYGFAIADGENDGIWRKENVGADSEGKTKTSITLIETNNISHSHRYTHYLDDNSDYDGIVGENEQGKYILPYSTLQFLETGLEINTSLGTKSNPILIADYQDFIEVTGTSTSSYVNAYFDDEMIWGTYRLVDDIDLSKLISSDNSVVLPSTMKSFAGIIYGNGFEISGISITSDTSRVSFGLFSSIESRKGSTPIITNLDITLNQVIAGDVVMVGGLAGYIKDSTIVNIDLIFNENSSVTGLNFAGGLAGLTFGNNIIKNITISSPTVTADRYSYSTDSDYLTSVGLASFRTGLKNDLNYSTSINSLTIKNMQNYSYAGAAIGFVDNYVVESTEFNINQSDTYSINNIRVSGIVNIQAQVAGGIFGLTGYQTHVRDAGITIDGSSSSNSSHIIATKYFAGGVVGQAFGTLSRVFSVHSENTQNEIENNMSNFYMGNTQMERGILDLFSTTDGEYTQEAIGGIAGYVGSGKLEISYSKLNATSPTARYAGGLVGIMDLVDAKSYQADTDLAAQPSYTRYFINEAYATGDVRVNLNNEIGRAGGLIGAIKGEGSRVSLLAVNAFNYFTTYNYLTKEYGNVLAAGNASINYKVNSMVGDFINSDSSVVSGNNYSMYLTFMQAKEEASGNTAGAGSDTEGSDSTGDGGDLVQVNIPSIGYYQNYLANGFEITLNVFDGYSAQMVNSESESVTQEYLYAIASPSLYNSAESGHSYTQEGFLNSGAWATANWTHPSDKLFPSIKYQRTTDFIYLDYYNAAEVFAMLSGGANYTVVVRGLESENAENIYKDINLKAIEEEYGVEIPSISGFSGRIIGQGYKDENTKEDVKIIAENNFITSVGTGFSIEDLTITYTGEDGVIDLTDDGQGNAGLLIKSAATEINVSNVTLDIQAPIMVEGTKTTGKNIKIGVVAPSITSSSITNLTLKTSQNSFTLLQLNGLNDKEEIYAGLIAGELIQNSSISIMQVEGIKLELLSDLISLNNSSAKNYYVGGYFGKTQIGENAQDLRLTITDLISKSNAGEILDTNILLGNVTQTATNGGLYLGGYIGKVEGLGVLGTFEEKTINIKLNFLINGDSNIQNLYSGLLIGQKDSPSLNFDGQNSTVEGGLYVDQQNNTNLSIGNLVAGGIIGSNNGGAVKLSELNSINFEIVDDGLDYVKLNKNDLKTSNYNGAVKVNNANVGVVIGETKAQFSFTGTASTTYINDSTISTRNSIRIEGKEEQEKPSINIGSIVGYASASVNRIDINGKIMSSADFLVIATTSDVNVGGIVGRVDESKSVSVEGLGSGELIRYDGGLFSNSNNVKFGGIIGSYTKAVALTIDDSGLSISNTSFGGVFKVLGSNSNDANVTAGGSLGYVNISNSANSAKIKLSNNYNYGDVFVQYDENLKALSEYNFGGLVGNTSLADYTGTNENYSLVTSHNSRYENTKGTAHALFGNGVPKSNTLGEQNYYNHNVALSVDDQGSDIGYVNTYPTSEQYINSYYGYGDYAEASQGIVETIKRSLGEVTIEEGLKLNPIEIEDKTINSSASFNGIQYYVFGSSFSLSDKSLEELVLSLEKNLNVALIGCGDQLNFNNTSASAFINKLSGYSIVSGIVLNVDIKIDEALSDVYYAGLISELSDQAIVYASQVKGSIDVGSYIEKTQENSDGTTNVLSVTSNKANVSGLIGNMTGGKIFDCSTAVDIVYRAQENGNVYGIVSLSNKDNKILNKLIENTYATGSLTTYNNANIYAFTNGADYTSILDSYTITKIDWNNYTEESDTPDKNTIFSAFGINKSFNTYNLKNAFYDANALNVHISDDKVGDINNITYNTEGATIYSGIELGTKKFTKDFYATSKEDDTAAAIFEDINYNPWSKSIDFNYNYPTLKYGYLRLSSYATIESTNSKANNGYDNYVIETTYKRLNNNQNTTNIESDSLFYMIPNAGVLSNIENIGLDKNYILMYDIDLQQITDENVLSGPIGSAQNGATETSFTGKFDGQEKTISGLTHSLFSSIGSDSSISIKNSTYDDEVSKIYIRNLRLTNANIEDGNGLLAHEIKFATVSNMTLSGNLTGKQNYFGGLANSLNGGFVNTVTNMTNINVASLGIKNQIKVGGLIGLMNGGKIFYSSNYGPINVYTNGIKDVIVANYVGGIVGSVGSIDSYDMKLLSNQTSNEIQYSYNTASIISGYGTSTTQLSTPGRYVSSGIVGFNAQELLIANSYNAGMIKAGNKSNDGGNSGAYSSYAAGIIAYGHTSGNTTITNCYNEGTVEALGKDPTLSWTWEGTNSTPDTSSESVKELKDPYDDFSGDLVLRQSNVRNVYAYGIGYVITGEISDSKVRLTSNKQDEQEIDTTTIYNNGSVLNINDEIYSWSWNDVIKKSMTDNVSFSMPGYHEFKEGGVLHWEIWRSKILTRIYLKNPIVEKTSPYDSTEKYAAVGSDDLIVTSYDQLGLPSTFILKGTISIKWYFYGGHKGLAISGWDDFTRSSDSNGATELNIEENYTSHVNIYSKYFGKTNIFGKYGSMNLDFNDTVYVNENTEIKEKCRSNETTNLDKAPVQIADQKYRFIDQNNQNTVFNAGVYSTSGSFVSSLPFINNSSYYTLTAKIINDNNPDQEIFVILNSIKEANTDEGNIIVNYTVTSTEELVGDLQLKLSLNYEEKLTFDMSQFNYVYIDDNSFGLYDSQLSSNIQSWILNGYTINGLSVVRLSSKNYYYNLAQSNIKDNDNAPDDPEDDSYIYFAYDTNKPNILIYIPNANLQDATSYKSYFVNKVDDFAEGDSLSYNFNKNVVKLIKDKFSNKTYYVRYRDYSTTNYKDLTFSEKGSGSSSLNIPSTGKNESLNLGSTIKPTELNITQTNTIEYNNNFSIVFRNKSVKINEGELGYKILHNIDGINYNIANYVYSSEIMSGDGTWNLNDTNIEQYSIKIGENIYPFALELENNNLKFTFSNINVNSEELDILKNNIKNYILTNFIVETDPIDGNKATQLSNYVEIVVGNSVINITSAEHKFIVDLGDLGQDVLIREGSNLLFSFDSSTNQYGLNSSKTSIMIGGYNFTLEIVDNKITLTNTTKEEMLAVSINDYFRNQLEYIVNDFSDTIENINYLSTGSMDGSFTVKSTSNSSIAQIIYSYSYTNFSWTSNNSNIQITNNGNYAKASFKSNHAGLSDYKFTLNGVEVYYGRVSFRVTQTANIKITSIQFRNMQNTPSVINLDATDNSKNYSSGNISVGANTSTTIYSSTTFTKNIRFSSSVFATYTLESDDLDSFGVVLEKNGQIYYLSETISRTTDNKISNVSLNSIKQLTNAKENTVPNVGQLIYRDITIFIEQSKSETTNENGQTIITYTFSDDQGVPFLDLEKGPNGTTYYQYFDGRDQVENIEGVGTLPDKIYLSPRTGSAGGVYDRYITKEEFNKISSYDNFENLIQGISSEYYIYISDNSYNFKSNYSIEDGESVYSRISLAIYNWKSYHFDEYNELSKNLSITLSEDDMKNFNITVSSAKNPFIYNRDGSKFTIILNSSLHYSNVYFTIQYKMPTNIKDFDVTIGSEGKNKIEALTIILTNDISFTNVAETEGFILTENINIVGNGYYLSYYNSPLLKSVTGNSYIKNINILGEVYNKSLFISGNINSLTANDLSFYGAVVNYKTTNSNKGALVNANEGDIIKLKNANIYTNINNARMDGNGLNDLYLFNSSLSIDGENSSIYGVIKALDGYNGIFKDIGVDQYNGQSGDSGGSIYLINNVSSSLSIKCNGILITGSGGNASGGRSSNKGVDLIFKTDYKVLANNEDAIDSGTISNMVSKEQGSGAQGGEKGTIVGFYIENTGKINTHSENGFNSLSGAKGRNGFGAITYFNKTNNGRVSWDTMGNERFIEYVSYEGKELYKTTSVANTESDIYDLFNKMFNLSSGYQQKIPTEDLTRRT